MTSPVPCRRLMQRVRCRVDAAWKVQSFEPTKRSVMIIKFADETIEREQRLHR